MKILNISFPVVLLLLSLAAVVHAQVIFPVDKDQLLKGDAAGQTLFAEQHGYPPAQKILSFKDQLGLTKDQVKKINEMLTNLPVSATIKGQEIVEAEEDVHKLFESGSISEKILRAKLERIGIMRGDLRFVHLQIYLREKQILSAKQWERLKELLASEVK
jgi:hypothetical protein